MLVACVASVMGNNTDKGNDKLLEGPCSTSYIDLELCAADKDVKTHRDKMAKCPRETDALIKCMKRHPFYFQE
ncbi:hypothetical protein ACHAWO_001233 [Cyclotella atomus]|uniref:GCK domain-containing protein n=1 Tax=Cyclotella atomus TaxID=382360 RepID=A0ABD3P9L4_9STRA